MVSRWWSGLFVLALTLGAQARISEASAENSNSASGGLLISQLATELNPPPEAHFALTGTGFFVSSSGDLMTAAHVVRDCVRIDLISEALPATSVSLVAADARPDLALLHLPAGSAPPPSVLSLAATQASPGDALAMIGYPSGSDMRRAAAIGVTAARSAGDRLINARYVLAFSGDVQSGDSGGPLLDAGGHVVGLVKGRFDGSQASRDLFGSDGADLSLGPTRNLIEAFYRHFGGTDLYPPGKSALSIAEGIARARAAVVRVVCWRAVSP